MKFYEENYIFISYSHKNSSQVMRVVEQLCARGYRVWCDKAIPSGVDWWECIARHLANCTAMLAFITPEFVASKNCLNELNFAHTHEKQPLSIFLEETKLPLGVELQISRHQYIKRMDFHTEDDFLDSICRCEFLDSCKQNPNTLIPEVPARPAKLEEKAPEIKPEEKVPEAKPEVKPRAKPEVNVPEVRSVEQPVKHPGIDVKKILHGFCRMPALVLAAAAVLLVLAGTFGAWKLTTKASDIHISAPEAIQTEAPTAVVEETYSSVEMIGFDYAYSDDPADNAKYTAKEFAKIVNSENVRELLPLGTKIKMIPNSKEITDEFIEFELVAYKHFEKADGSGMAQTTWLAVNLLNERRAMNKRGTNFDGWRDSEMRGWLNETLYPSLTSYWKNLMVQVAVSSTAGEYSEETVTSEDYLFLPAIGEMDTKYLTKSEYSVFNSSEISSDAEERTFIRFTDENVTRVKKRQGNSGFYWLRSPSLSSAANFNNISSSGYTYSNNANNSYGVCLGFCM